MTELPGPVRFIVVPYDSGVFNRRMGAGPLSLLEGGAASRLGERGHAVDQVVFKPSSDWHSELRTAFDAQRTTAVEARAAHERSIVPIVLAGNCNTTVGALAALSGEGVRVGVIWMDGHGDFNDPDEDASGFLDGQGLAMAVGRCWNAARSLIPGSAVLPEDHVLLIGARDLEDAQQEKLRESGIVWLDPQQATDVVVVAALDELKSRVDVLHVHVDLDVYDPSIAPANEYAAGNGLSAETVQRIVRFAAERLPIASATLASYDPSFDPDGALREIALDLLQLLARATTAGGSTAATRLRNTPSTTTLAD